MSIVVRRATLDDAKFVWEINNHPSVRAQSISTGAIAWDDHLTWFAKKLANPGTLFFVALSEGGVAAVARFDVQADEAMISVAVSPTFQGRGIGRKVIAAATQELLHTAPAARPIALVRPTNMASIRAFAAAGYARTSGVDIAGTALERFEYVAPRPQHDGP